MVATRARPRQIHLHTFPSCNIRVQGTVSKKHYESRARTVDDSNTAGDNNLREKTENMALIFSAEDLSTSHKNCKEVSVIPEKES